MIKIVVICGPTAVGKSSLSIKIAKKYDGEIINADASQFKKLLNIGTAKITNEEMQGIKHHLIDIIDVNDEFSINDFQKMGRDAISSIASRNKLPIIVGGSGLYIDALISDYELKANKSNHNLLNEEYKNYSNEELYELLKKLDEDLAAHTHMNNRNRVIRYIERAKEGSKFETNKPKLLYDCMLIFLNKERKLLYDDINRRTMEMINNKWIDECVDLRNKGINLSDIKEIGYKEIGMYLDNSITKEEMIELIQKETRHYAKRQITWFKNKTNAIMIDANNLNLDDLYVSINNFLMKRD